MRANRTSPSRKRTRQPIRSGGVTFVFGDGSKLFTKDIKMMRILRNPTVLAKVINDALERLDK